MICRFPFDVKNPIGYSFAYCLQFIMAFSADLTILCVLIIVFAPCLILISTTDDMKSNLHVLNTSAHTEVSDPELTQQFNEIVQFHSKIKQLSESQFYDSFDFF